MTEINARNLTRIPNPADPLGPELGVVAYVRGGEALIVLRGPHDSIDDAVTLARRRAHARRAKHRHYNRLDRKPPVDKDSQ